LTKGIELVGFPHGTAGDGDDRQGYRGSAARVCRAAIALKVPPGARVYAAVLVRVLDAMSDHCELFDDKN